MNRIFSAVWGTKIEYHLNCTSEEAISSLQNSVVTSVWDKIWVTEPQFHGFFFKNRFWLVYVTWWRNSFKPVLWGKVVRSGENSIVLGRIGVPKFVIAFCLLWLAIFFAKAAPSVWIIGPICMVVILYYIVKSKSDEEKITGLLDNALRARIISK